MLPPAEELSLFHVPGRREPAFVSKCSFRVGLMGKGCGWLFSSAVRREIE